MLPPDLIAEFVISVAAIGFMCCLFIEMIDKQTDKWTKS